MHKTPIFPLVFVACSMGCVATKNAIVETSSAMPLLHPKLVGDASSAIAPANHELALTVRIAIDAKDLPRPPRPALNVALCIDTSGSMEGKPIADARKAALAFVDSLKPGDWVSVVTFDSKMNLLVPATQIDDAGRVAIRSKVAAMKAEGTTAMTAGLQAAVQQVAAHYDAMHVNRVVLLGDGVPNEEPGVRAIMNQAVSSQISITTLGLGDDYDEILMGTIARTTGGRFHHVEDSGALATFFDGELSRISRVVAHNGYVDVIPGPGVTIDGVIGNEIARMGSAVRVVTGDIALGDRRELYVKIHATPHKDGSAVELLDATFHHDAGEEHVFVGVHASADDAKVQASHDGNVEKGAALAQQAADEIEAIRKARETDKPKPHAGKPPPPAAMPDAKIRNDSAMRTLMGD